MNKEVMKAMNKKPVNEKVETIRKWWHKNNYKVMRIIFFPIWACIWMWENKIEPWIRSRNAWSDSRANEILSYYIPRFCKWDAEKKQFYFFDNGYGWSLKLAKKHLKRKDRKFWEYNASHCWNGGNMRAYLVEKFELDGFTKKVIDDGKDYYSSGTEIVFTLREE